MLTRTVLDTKNNLVHIITSHQSLGYNGTLYFFVCGGDFINPEKWDKIPIPFPPPTCFRCIVKHVPT